MKAEAIAEPMARRWTINSSAMSREFNAAVSRNLSEAGRKLFTVSGATKEKLDLPCYDDVEC